MPDVPRSCPQPPCLAGAWICVNISECEEERRWHVPTLSMDQHGSANQKQNKAQMTRVKSGLFSSHGNSAHFSAKLSTSLLLHGRRSLACPPFQIALSFTASWGNSAKISRPLRKINNMKVERQNEPEQHIKEIKQKKLKIILFTWSFYVIWKKLKANDQSD